MTPSEYNKLLAGKPYWLYTEVPLYCRQHPRYYRLMVRDPDNRDWGAVRAKGTCVQTIEMPDCHERLRVVGPMLGHLSSNLRNRFERIVTMCQPCKHVDVTDPTSASQSCEYRKDSGGPSSWITRIDMIQWYKPSNFYSVPLTKSKDGSLPDIQCHWKFRLRKMLVWDNK